MDFFVEIRQVVYLYFYLNIWFSCNMYSLLIKNIGKSPSHAQAFIQFIHMWAKL